MSVLLHHWSGLEGLQKLHDIEAVCDKKLLAVFSSPPLALSHILWFFAEQSQLERKLSLPTKGCPVAGLLPTAIPGGIKRQQHSLSSSSPQTQILHLVFNRSVKP